MAFITSITMVGPITAAITEGENSARKACGPYRLLFRVSGKGFRSLLPVSHSSELAANCPKALLFSV
jgi:hypothetical protein